MHNTKAPLLTVPHLTLVVNTLRVLMACCKNFTPILLIHENDVNMKPGYKTDLKDAKTFKW